MYYYFPLPVLKVSGMFYFEHAKVLTNYKHLNFCIMATLANVFESVNNVMNTTKEVRKDWRTSYNTLAKLLKETQTKEGFKVAGKWFEQMGLPTDRKVSKTFVESLFKLHYTDKKGIEYPAYIARKTKKDKDGNEVTDKDGNKVYEFVTRPVKNGQWTLDVLTKVLAAK